MVARDSDVCVIALYASEQRLSTVVVVEHCSDLIPVTQRHKV